MAWAQPHTSRVILCHPKNIDRLRAFGGIESSGPNAYNFAGVEVRASDAVPEFNENRHWEFPKDPLWEYEAQDEAWCRPLGIGHEVVEQTHEPVFWQYTQPAFKFPLPPEVEDKADRRHRMYLSMRSYADTLYGVKPIGGFYT